MSCSGLRSVSRSADWIFAGSVEPARLMASARTRKPCIQRALREIADVGDESRVGETGIVADDDRRQVVEILERLEIEDRVGSVADEDDGVGLQLLELENLAGDVRAVGVVGNLRADIDAGALG